ncbi:Glycerol uptake facilitator (Major Intrinsic Protein Family) [Rathayibacter oskolensis]|uniref:Glycerol uptake facilitator (Major Intrinsic Protein Family) n=1 Tax=Rathayibacter oskolensis TaxID=1891671 RepID=A0A1X7PI33_9MICO|nr:aquaporin [Rathayibacter oskolensis]SMH51021.1 Glycerol uptake facilitator (Major Intrinsic Protein Family) [Rathayibacter oskolensis]
MTTPPAALPRRVAVEFGGSAALTAIVVGSGIAATSLSEDVGVQLLVNAIATAFGLFVLITVLGPISGAHFNPVVSAVDLALGYRSTRDIAPYIGAQILGCITGAIVANVMFDLPPVTLSGTDRITPGHLVAEVVATAGLVMVIFLLARTGRSVSAAGAVAAYIGAAYFFTSSTSFANPAITLGRMFSDTFAGIAPGSAPLFVGAQLLGALLASVAVRALTPGHTTAP